MIKDKLVLTPQRFFAMLQLIGALDCPPRELVIASAQPSSLTDNLDTATMTYRYLNRYGLLEEDGSALRRVRLSDRATAITSWESFRSYMQAELLGHTQEADNDFLFNQFTAWYAVQDEWTLSAQKSEIEAEFHKDVYPSAGERVLAEQPGISAWRTWAEFLGFGWPLKLSARDEMRIVPDATVRIRSFIPQILTDLEIVGFRQFSVGLAQRCPELDGGVLFEQCWQASRGSEQRGNRLSLMLSTALRTLHRLGEIELSYRADALETWTLFPAQSHIVQVSHIRRGAAA